jgi:hypothetical protein
MNGATNRILPEARWVAALVIPFLATAFVILYFFPSQTEWLFAWKIQPTMSAMMLGATYLGGIYFFTGVLRATKWHRVWIGYLALIPFVSMLGIATILHWERFNQGHISFITWTALYFTTPFVILIVWLRNRSQDPGVPDNPDTAVPFAVRLVMGAIGVVTLAISLILFVAPAALIDLWPWTITPLMARVVGAMFSLPGAVGLCLAVEPRWSAARLILQAQSFSILFILLAAFIARADFDWAKVGAWLFVGGLASMLVTIVVLYLVMEGRTAASASLQVRSTGV